MRLFLAILLGKFISYLTRILKIGGGSAAPGLYALSVEPNLVTKLAVKVPKNVVITGTNGKTTTAKMLAHFAQKTGFKVIRNHTGSNLERGIASTLLQQSSIRLNGIRTKYDLGIWELDEAAFNNVAPKLRPDIVVFLNVFRDQLDRYGEIDTIVKNWGQTLSNISPEILVLTNGDDVNTSKLAECFKGKVQKFGIKDYKFPSENSYLIENEVKNNKIKNKSYKHLKESKKLDFEAKNVKLNGLVSSLFSLTINNKQSLRSSDLKQLTINLPIPGIYHIYDFLAAFAAGTALNMNLKKMVLSLKTYLPAFGRVEKFHLSPTTKRASASEAGYIFLIKNPAGANQVFKTIAPNIKPNDTLLFALNDNAADGTDVSWIWDVDFELFQKVLNHFKKSKSRNHTIYVSGTRAHDLALRIKYAGVDPKKIKVEPDLKQALKQARTGLKGKLFILPTYTAMLEIQSILTKSGIKKHYWKEDN